ncbi:MAG TPA: hypothetical protein PLM91_03215 [Bacillota bacterium]|nr:hypothetical protein [Bacillota bacterium]HOL51196.1 hypothetical protein [Bacillota bacterium]HOO29981.1 hypothetical protein [Bacillota bacterium]
MSSRFDEDIRHKELVSFVEMILTLAAFALFSIALYLLMSPHKRPLVPKISGVGCLYIACLRAWQGAKQGRENPMPWLVTQFNFWEWVDSWAPWRKRRASSPAVCPQFDAFRRKVRLSQGRSRYMVRFLEEQEAPVDLIEHVKGGYHGNGERMTPDDISSVLDVMEELL